VHGEYEKRNLTNRADRTFELIKRPEPVTDEEVIEEPKKPIVPLDKLPIEMQDAIEGVRQASNIPTKLCLISILAFANIAANRLYDCDPDFFNPHPSSKYFVALQERSGGKSTIFSILGKGVQKWIDEQMPRYSEQHGDGR
jgi:hypothetical protein